MGDIAPRRLDTKIEVHSPGQPGKITSTSNEPKMKRLSLAFITLTLCSCASLTQGTSQTISFNIEPASARCIASRDGDGQLGTLTATNSDLTVSKSKRDIMVKCSAPGYKSNTIRLVSSTQAAGVVGGVLLDLGIVDMMTGAMWRYEGSINVALEKE